MRAEEVVAALLLACPSATRVWEEHLAWWGSEEVRGYFNDVGVFAHHVVESYANGNTGEFEAFFGVIERMIREGNSHVVELATVGLLEDVQNIASHAGFGYRAFEPWLGSASRLEWANIEAQWENAGSLANVIRRELDPGKRGPRS